MILDILPLLLRTSWKSFYLPTCLLRTYLTESHQLTKSAWVEFWDLNSVNFPKYEVLGTMTGQSENRILEFGWFEHGKESLPLCFKKKKKNVFTGRVKEWVGDEGHTTTRPCIVRIEGPRQPVKNVFSRDWRFKGNWFNSFMGCIFGC